jgi:hypothetical protein
MASFGIFLQECASLIGATERMAKAIAAQSWVIPQLPTAKVFFGGAKT